MRGRPMEDQDYINASDLASFSFCKRSWFLAKQGSPSLLEAERACGTQAHHLHSQKVQAAPRAGALAVGCAIAALILFALWMTWTFR